MRPMRQKSRRSRGCGQSYTYRARVFHLQTLTTVIGLASSFIASARRIEEMMQKKKREIYGQVYHIREQW